MNTNEPTDTQHYSNETMSWVKRNCPGYKIRDDGTVDCPGDVKLDREDFREFPVKFGKVMGDFKCRHVSNLRKLNGPTYVGGFFDLDGCYSLRSLEGGPTEVGKYLDLSLCERLTNLKGGPKRVGTSLILDHCIGLTSLEGIPDEIGFASGGITMLSIVDCQNITRIDFVPKVHGPRSVFIQLTPAKNLLILLKIPNLQYVNLDSTDPSELSQIIQKYLKPARRDVIACQDELIEAGFEEYARTK
jgi:hypothetical protein